MFCKNNMHANVLKNMHVCTREGVYINNKLSFKFTEMFEKVVDSITS